MPPHMSQPGKRTEKSHVPSSSRSRILLRTIAAFKFVKAALLVMAGAGVLHLVHRDVASLAERLVGKFHAYLGKPYVAHSLARVATPTPRQHHQRGRQPCTYTG